MFIKWQHTQLMNINNGSNGGGSQNVNIEPVSAPGTGSVAVQSPVVIQVPRQPKTDDGKWMMIGSMIGSLLGFFANGSILDKAKSAEDNWKKLNEELHAKGKELWGRMPEEQADADKADNDLENQYDWNINLRDAERARAEKLDDCNDTLHEKICAFANCGYVPDYDGIKARIVADVQAVTKNKRAELCKNLNRYSARQCCGIETALATSAISTTVSALYKAREDERSRAWQINEGLLFKATEMMEKHREARMQVATNADKVGIQIQQERYRSHNNNYFELAKLGADFLTSAGKNYAWLAESYRRTAEKDKSSLSTFGALLGMITYMIYQAMETEDNKPCGQKQTTTTPPTK